MTGIDEVLAKFAAPSNRSIDIEKVLTSEIVETAVSEGVVGVAQFAAIQHAVPDMAGPHLAWWGPQALDLLGTLTVKGGGKYRAYEVDGQQWVTARPRWRVRQTFDGYRPSRSWTITADIETTVVLRTRDGEGVDYAALAHAGSPTKIEVEQ